LCDAEEKMGVGATFKLQYEFIGGFAGQSTKHTEKHQR